MARISRTFDLDREAMLPAKDRFALIALDLASARAQLRCIPAGMRVEVDAALLPYVYVDSADPGGLLRPHALVASGRAASHCASPNRGSRGRPHCADRAITSTDTFVTC